MRRESHPMPRSWETRLGLNREGGGSRRASSPNNCDRVFFENRVSAHNGGVLYNRLGN
jgi:hypothetical protein